MVEVGEGARVRRAKSTDQQLLIVDRDVTPQISSHAAFIEVSCLVVACLDKECMLGSSLSLAYCNSPNTPMMMVCTLCTRGRGVASSKSAPKLPKPDRRTVRKSQLASLASDRYYRLAGA